jgi:hypothetical protein
MKVSNNFDVREFVPKVIWDKWKENSTWFVNPKIVSIAEFYKSYFTTYYKKKIGNNLVKSIAIIVNDWNVGGVKQFSGFRPAFEKTGAELSQHRICNAFDCEIYINYSDGSRKEVDYKEIHEIIQTNQSEFIANGVSSVEHVDYATGWLHTDIRWIPNQKNILIVKPSK